ncbi:hypothetical protein OBBRIDRAFT_826127 [Obba rivulosa]|uniref:Uncharacterized protein n=1 Tax=Obba rivulosa TaxID=1052685 RepID=A0A8E2DKK5_9APHY|nr:hypothetical protein OBBRIDRAFT_826127 [Obba rivulosa]
MVQCPLVSVWFLGTAGAWDLDKLCGAYGYLVRNKPCVQRGHKRPCPQAPQSARHTGGTAGAGRSQCSSSSTATRLRTPLEGGRDRGMLMLVHVLSVDRVALIARGRRECGIQALEALWIGGRRRGSE